MDDLPPPLLLEILHRLRDSSAVARCRLVSKTLNSVSRDVRSIHLFCTLSQYLKSRETKPYFTPFKTIFKTLIESSIGPIESVSIGVERSLGGMSYDDVEDECGDDLHLTELGFLEDWLPRVSGEMMSFSVSDFWVQSCWRRSRVLGLISSTCKALVELELKNAWLSVEGLIPMPTLTKLTLEFVRLDDEDLNYLNHCFPFLQVLNLIGVGGLKEPKIQLNHLRSCHWTVSNAPHSLTICAPNLVKLELQCIKPRSLTLEAPLLSDFFLSLEKANFLELTEFVNLRHLHLESPDLLTLIHSFPPAMVIQRLTVDSLKCTGPVEMTMLSLEALIDSFQKVRSLSIRSGAWSQMETCFLAGGLQDRQGFGELKEFVAQLVIHDIDVTLPFIFCLLEKCPNLLDMALLIHSELDSVVANKLISRCIENCPRVRWKWGIWNDGTKDTWVSSGIEFGKMEF